MSMSIGKILLIGLITIVGAFIALAGCMAALSDVSSAPQSAPVESQVPPTLEPVQESAQSPLLAEPQVSVARGGNTINDNEVYVLSEPLRLQTGTLGSDKYLCSLVTMENKSSSKISYNFFYWNLKNPEGFVSNANVFGSSQHLGSGELPSGEKVKGDVCFNFPKMISGEYTLTLDSLFGSGPSMQWKHTVN